MNCSVSLVESALTLPLLQGRVAVEGVRFEAARSVDDNSRRMLDGAFDVAEMSLATFLRAVDQGTALVGLPVFPGRRFIQAGMLVRLEADIVTPQELAGRRVAVPQYWLTSSVWHRGLLRDEYGIDTQSIEWVSIAPERGAAPLPPGVQVTRAEGASIVQLFAQGRIDAALVPRPITPELEKAGAVNLLADVPAVEREYFARTGIFPIMHFIAMRREAHERDAGLAPAIVAAFEQAAGLAVPDDGFVAAGGAPLAIGLVPNRPALERFFNYAREQGLVGSLPALADLFVPQPCNQQALA
jgi:4,5-dihydroxyphthalate decarboxylase